MPCILKMHLKFEHVFTKLIKLKIKWSSWHEGGSPRVGNICEKWRFIDLPLSQERGGKWKQSWKDESAATFLDDGSYSLQLAAH